MEGDTYALSVSVGPIQVPGLWGNCGKASKAADAGSVCGDYGVGPKGGRTQAVYGV